MVFFQFQYLFTAFVKGIATKLVEGAKSDDNLLIH